MSRNLLKITALLLISLSTAFLASCGGSGGATSDTATGTVGILLTDKPADPAIFESINASIEKVELIGSDDNGKVSLYSGSTQTFDLLRLRNESIPFAFQHGVPVGEYCKIRLTLSDLELVLADDTPDDSTDNKRYHPKLPGNGKLDLVARDCFTVGADEIVTLQLDIDAGNSIHVAGNNKGYNFRPVVFVDVINQSFDSKLVRLEGTINKINPNEKTLLLCDAIPDDRMENLGCVEVHFNEDSAFFDNTQYSGAPRAIDELLAEENVGQPITLVGWPSFQSHLKTGSTSSVTPVFMQLDTLVVELGNFLRVEGNVAVDADSSGFGMSITSGGPVISQDTLSVMFQAGSPGVNGTRIINRSGELLTSLDVKEPLPVQVDGTLQLVTGSDPILNSALIILDKGALRSEQVTGTVLSVGDSSFTISPEADTVCGVTVTQIEVIHPTDLEVLTVTITDTSSEIVPDGILVPGQTVGMNGSCELSGYETDNVVIVDDQR